MTKRLRKADFFSSHFNLQSTCEQFKNLLTAADCLDNLPLTVSIHKEKIDLLNQELCHKN